ncbi:MAG: hypothetical protein ACPL3P_02375 [Anaerolineales bacterium]
MQICSLCQTSAPDTAIYCPKCNADLREYSENAQALKRMLENDRIKYIRLTVSSDSCPACKAAEGTYPKDQVPRLPIEGCSHELGCRCHYTPALDVLYP